jgi:hypothetical protein
MPITWRLGSKGRIDITFSDPYTQRESEKVMAEIYAKAELDRPLRFLVDVRQSSPPDTEFVFNAITFWQLHVNDMWGAKIAVVTATDSQTGMADMSERTAEWRQLPFTIRSFQERELDDAVRWLEPPQRNWALLAGPHSK